MRAPVIALCALLGSCSLVLDEHVLPMCTSHDDCAVLNEADRIDEGACERWQCDGERDPEADQLRPGHCALRARDDDSDEHTDAERCASGTDTADHDPFTYPGAPERCDGVDNDGDALIDEPEGDVTVIEPRRLHVVSTEGSPNALSYSVEGSATVWMVREGDQEHARFSQLEDAPAVPFELRAARTNTAYLDLDNEDYLGSECMRWNGESLAFERCSVLAAAVGIRADTILSAVVAGVGRTLGQVRLGYAPLSEPDVRMRGPAARANSYLGVDVDDSGRITGARGATAPVIAPLESDDDVAQALVAWLGDAPDRAECAEETAPVDALIAFYDARSDAPFVASTTERGGITSSGAPSVLPQVLGMTRSSSPPSVAQLAERGYFIAYGAGQHGVALRFVPKAPLPDRYDPDAVADVLHTPREMPALPESVAWSLEGLSSQPVHGVSLALGAAQDDRIELGIAWREGCGSDEARVAFKQLTFDASVELPELRDESDVLALDEGEGEHGAPALIYTRTGFTTDAEAGQGGFVAAFGENGRLIARRIRDDASLFDPGERIEVASIGTSAIARPHLFIAGDRVRYAFYDDRATGIAVGDLTCATPAGPR